MSVDKLSRFDCSATDPGIAALLTSAFVWNGSYFARL
jgi:hypothetical protein